MEKIDPKIELIIYRFLCGKLSVSERERLDSWLREGRHRELFEKICNKENMLEKSFYFDRLDKGREKTWFRLERATGLRHRVMVRRWMVAASLIVPLLIGILYLNVPQLEPEKSEELQEQIVPGISTAQLYLPDGKMVDLGKDSICDLALFEGGRFVNERGTLTYKSDSMKTSEARYSEIRIPRGGEYKVVLPDGTIVWLNAESSLRFPTVFTGKERKVYAQGELYFDVNHDEVKPFVVEVEKDYSVRVLGTEFNLRAYGEYSRATTLVKGSVQVKGAGNTVLLKPGQQALEVTGARDIEVLDVDVAPYVAWHAGKFHFVHAPLQYIMEELSRWYDVQVVYKNPDVMKECFTIEMQRFDDFNKVLRLIEQTGMVTISVDGHIVTVK